jgi:hypothetical protein
MANVRRLAAFERARDFRVPAHDEQHAQLCGDLIRVANPKAAKIELIEFVAIEQLHNSNQQGTSTVQHQDEMTHG